MILELDVGNSRIKWRLISREGATQAQDTALGLAELLPQLPAVTPIGIRLCSVRKGDALEAVRQSLRERYSIEAMVAEVVSHRGEVSIHYENPSRLGSDRWLGMLAAYSASQGPCIVVDGGTALTIDVVSAQGDHKGGYILPGLAMMRSSLEANTAIVLSDTALSEDTRLGQSTDQAVWHGALAAHTALIEKVVAAESGAQQFASLCFTGGDAQELYGAMSAVLMSYDSARLRHSVKPDLVLDGLAIACPLRERGI